jgi:nicotinamidase/pyrazinamidase
MTERMATGDRDVLVVVEILAGLAFDFCVRYSAEDAHREGFSVVVVEDACRGIDVDGSVAATRRSLAMRTIPCISAEVFSQ